MQDGEKKQAQGSQTESTTPDAAPAASPKKKRRWILLLLLILAVLLILIVALLPTLASSGPVRRGIVSSVNDRISGTINLQEISVSWFGACRIAGLEVTDAEGRKVLDVAQVNWDRSLWNLLSSREDMGKLDADIRSVEIICTADGSTSLQKAFELRQPSTSRKMPIGEVVGKLRVDLNWSVDRLRVVQPDGRDYTLSDTNGTVQVKTLDDIIVGLGTTLLAEDRQPNGSRLTVDVAMQGLFASGDFNLDQASGTIRVKTDPAISLKPILEFAAEDVDGKGELNLDVTGKLSPGQSEVTYTIAAMNVSAVDKDEKTPVPPLSADLSGAVDYKAKTLHGTLSISGKTSDGDLGKIQSELNYDMSGKTEVHADRLVDAVMKGQSFELPDFTLEVSGGLNLAEAIKSVPGLIPLRKGAQISGGDLQIEKIHIQGGASPSADGAMSLRLTTIHSPGQLPKVWEPITVAFNVLTDAGKKLKIEKADVAMPPFASIQGSGTPTQFHLAFQSDLAAIRDRLNDVVDLDNTLLAGKISGILDTERAERDDKRIYLTLNAKADAVVVANKQEPPDSKTASTAPPAESAPPTAYTGEVLWKASLVRATDSLTLSGKLEVPKLELSDIGEIFADDRPMLGHELTLYTNEAAAYDRLEVNSFNFESKLLKANLAGGIAKLDTDKILDFKGDYALSWPEASALARRLSPDGAKTVAMLGDKKYSFKITGPLINPAVTTAAFPPLEGKTAVGWIDGSKAYGLTMGDAELTPFLGNAQMTLPVAKIPANGGSISLGCLMDLSKADNPRLIIKDRLPVMDNVGLNEDVGREILSMALPLLANLSKLDGKVSLWVEGVDLPLDGEKIKQEGTGKGHLDFSDIKLRLDGEMARLMKLAGVSPDDLYNRAKFSPVDFELKDGAITYDNFTLTITGDDPLDLRFHGSVRFDGSLDLFVSVPVKASLLAGLGVQDPTGQIAKGLEGTRIDIPISGSRKSPRLDLSKVDVKTLVDQGLKKAGDNAMQNLLGGKPADAASGTETKPASPLKIPDLFK